MLATAHRLQVETIGEYVTMTLELHTLDTLPPLVRGGSREMSEEALQLQEVLLTGQPVYIAGIEDDRAYNALQQRVRGAARRAGVKVTIRRSEGTLAFQGIIESNDVETQEGE